jgi:hypothetical protein
MFDRADAKAMGHIKKVVDHIKKIKSSSKDDMTDDIRKDINTHLPAAEKSKHGLSDLTTIKKALGEAINGFLGDQYMALAEQFEEKGKVYDSNFCYDKAIYFFENGGVSLVEEEKEVDETPKIALDDTSDDFFEAFVGKKLRTSINVAVEKMKKARSDHRKAEGQIEKGKRKDLSHGAQASMGSAAEKRGRKRGE